jgi:hypothetical protein
VEEEAAAVAEVAEDKGPQRVRRLLAELLRRHYRRLVERLKAAEAAAEMALVLR